MTTRQFYKEIPAFENKKAQMITVKEEQIYYNFLPLILEDNFA